MDYLPYVLTAVLSILTITLVAVGIQVIQVLQRVKKTLDRLNTTIDFAEERISAVSAPLMGLGGLAASLGTGLKIFDSFVGWANRNKSGE